MVQMKPNMYAAAMSRAKDTVPPKENKDIVEDLGLSYLNASPLHLAALQGDLVFVETALGEIPQLAEAIDSRNQTPLHLASAEGHINIVERLVSANADTCTYQDIRGRNPLHVAVMKGHLGIVEELVKSANVADMCMSRDLGGRNPLHVAVVKGNVDVIEELLKVCPHPAQERGERDQTILHLSVKYNQLQALELLLVKPELQELVNAKDADGNTALHLAVAQATNIETPLDASISEGHINVIKTLVGVSVNMCASRDLDGRNPLHVAVMKGHPDIVQELVKSVNVADMCTSCDHGGRNPLHVAAINGKIDLMTELLKACPLAAQVRVGRDQTILHLCVEHNQLEALELLLTNPKLQQLVNAKDADGNTALHLVVAQATNVEIVEALCCGNINMNARNMNGQTALNILPESEPKRKGIFNLSFLNQIRRDPRSGDTNSNLQPQVREEEERKERIKGFMRVGGALRAKQIRSADWVTRKKDSLMVVAALIATGTFQIGMSPPDSLKRDKDFVASNAVAFAGSLFAILLIASDYSRKSWFLLSVQTCAIAFSGSFMALTYATTAKSVSPRDNKVIKRFGTSLFAYHFLILFITLVGFIFTIIHFYRGQKSKLRSMMRRNWPEHTIPQVTVSISNSANGSSAATGTPDAAQS